jgi:hypothetical protein
MALFEPSFATSVQALPTLLGKRQDEALPSIAWAGMALSSSSPLSRRL